MIAILSIFQYFFAAVIDIFDKFLISKRKIEPVAYTFFTVVLGAALLVIWPWVYEPLPLKAIAINWSSGVIYALTMYFFFKALSQGEVSRVIPFVFGIVPVFDVLIAWITGRNILSLNELAAFCLLLPGAILISYRRENFSLKHVGVKLLAAFLFSVDYAVWQYGSQNGSMLNHLMWDRVAAAGILILCLVFAAFRKKVFKHNHVEKKTQTSLLFLFKQALGGFNFVFFSYLITVGKIPLVNSLQGFRYVFLFLAAVLASKKFKHVLNEEVDRHTIKLKLFALALICLGTIFLFLK